MCWHTHENEPSADGIWQPKQRYTAQADSKSQDWLDHPLAH